METSPFRASNTVSLEANVLAECYYRTLYQFALSLTHSEADACDLTQNTFYRWQTKGQQLRDPSKVRTWLFTTLYRAFLQVKRRETRFRHYELSEVESELPWVSEHEAAGLDVEDVLNALANIDETFRAPLALFYLHDCSYKKIAQTLNVPLGTVKSRISRGIIQLQALLGFRDRRGNLAAA